MAWDGATRTLRLYKDGVLTASATNSNTGTVDPTGQIFRIGSYNRTSLSRVETFPGLIDEVMYFNRVLSGSEIQGLAAAAPPCQCQAGDLAAQLNQCTADKTALQGDLNTCTTAKGILQGDLNTCTAAKGILQGDLNTCTAANGILQGDLNTCTAANGILQGDLNTALDNPKSVVITRKTADKYFKKDEDPLGKILQVSGGWADGDYEVTAVIKEVPQNSHFTFDFLFPTHNLLQNDQYKHDDGWGIPTTPVDGDNTTVKREPL